MRELKTDFVVVGSGVAGLRAALSLAAKHREVLLVSKDPPAQSATGWAQGGVAVALSDDDEIALHYRDTLRAGGGLCRPAAVRTLVGEGPRVIRELLEWGARFDREGKSLAFGREAAHSKRRILHAHGDSTGREILRVLVERVSGFSSVRRLSNLYTLDLLVAQGRLTGILCLDEKEGGLVSIRARAVLLATGGLGQVYRDTTNPPLATGDGVAVAFRAGAAVSDLEFVQFHPTALCRAGQPPHLLTEALRGEGALLRNARGERFLAGRLPGAELAARDQLSRAIEEELRRSGELCVYLDLTPIDPRRLERRFPTVFQTCRAAGIDPRREPVPVRPAAHYAMGGVETDLWGRASLPGLYAAGEAACAGVHGANRLASNSLLEGLVFGGRAGEAMLGDDREDAAPAGEAPESQCLPAARAESVMRRVRDWMWEDAGVTREGRGLERVLERLAGLDEPGPGARPTRAGAEARNLVTVARLIATLALWRRESRGAHWRSDHPLPRAAYRRHSRLTRDAVEPARPARRAASVPLRRARRMVRRAAVSGALRGTARRGRVSE